ncbi:hypothetical protein [Larkinella terrae]|uniref:Uncharacterized protein n=1 Tax=Larkinella terrae TaxID=2025311 RepID=A0A7K0EJL6_9BACT|nr:hypothetical protein [Larkinella terrae]MRS61965.1 hypothetical protein [Larkinella terrae]
MKSVLLFTLLASVLDLCSNPFPVSPNIVLPTPCKMIDGKNRPYACEFEILNINFIGANNEILAKSTGNGQYIKLPKSKAISSSLITNGGSLFYTVSVSFRRINRASFSTDAYTLSKSSITDPISPGETSVVDNTIKVGANIPDPLIRPNWVTFTMQLNYSTSGQPTLVAPPQLLMLENPVTYAKMTKPTYHHDRDRAEAWRTFQLSVNFSE